MTTILFLDTMIDIAKRNYYIGHGLEKHGYKIVYATYSKESYNFLKNNKCNSYYIPNELKNIPGNNPLKYLKAFEHIYSYDFINMEMLISWDIDFKDRKDKYIQLVKHIRFYESFLYNIDIIIGGVERFVSDIPYYMSKIMGIKYYVLQVVPGVKGRFILNDNIFGDFKEITKYISLVITDEEQKNIDKLLKEYKQEKHKCYVGIGLIPNLSLKNISYGLKRMFLNLIVERCNNPYARLMHIAKKECIKSIRKHIEEKITDDISNEKYIYFPMHVQGDAQLVVRAPQYLNQVALIEYIAKCIPINYKLYVKAHPNAIGAMSIKDILKLKKLSNVKILKPSINGHDIIKNSSAIIVINSSSGLEALFYYKPVITLVDVFYDYSNLTTKVRDLSKLPTAIKEALSKKIDYEFSVYLYRFIAAYLKSTKEGYILPHKQVFNKMADKDNINKVVKGILEVIAWDYQKTE